MVRKTLAMVGFGLFMLVQGACSGDDDGGESASKAELCAKCQECASDSSFVEGFCEPFRSGSSFDYNACVSGADLSEVDGAVSGSELKSMTCQQFDDRI